MWAGVPYARLDGVRITEAALAAGRGRIVAELTPAYPAVARASSASTRTFTFDGARTIRVRDDVQARAAAGRGVAAPRGRPFTGRRRAARVDAGGVRLEVELLDGGRARATTGPALLQSPGRPGSIEQGPKEQRGHELVWSRPAPRCATLSKWFCACPDASRRTPQAAGEQGVRRTKRLGPSAPGEPSATARPRSARMESTTSSTPSTTSSQGAIA